MRHSKLIHLAVVLALLVGFAFVYPTTLQAQTWMCGTYAIDTTYWDQPDANGNCPLDRTTMIGEYWTDCYGNYGQWGILGGCNDPLTTSTYCGDCNQQ